MKKRLLSVLLTLSMVLTLLPVTAFAAGDGEYDYVRLMDRDEWIEAAFARAGESVGDDVRIQRFFVYDANHNQLNSGAASELLTPDCFYADTYDVAPNEIQTIIVSFTSTVYGEPTKTVSAAFSREDFYVSRTGGVLATKHIELSLTDRGKTRPAGNQVNFYLEVGAEAGTWSLYDTVYVSDDTALADKMPSDPSFGGDYVFVCWELNSHDGSGQEFTANTVVSEDIDVYARKVNAGSATHARVHNEGNNVFQAALEAYNAAHDPDVTLQHIVVDGMCLVGSGEKKGNPYYDDVLGVGDGANKNEWHGEHGEKEWFSICNIDFSEAVGLNQNNRIDPNDIQGIEIHGKVDNTSFSFPLDRDELDVRVKNDTWIDIYLRNVEPVEPTDKDITVYYYCPEEGAIVKEATVTVDIDATTVAANDPALEANCPTGYEVVVPDTPYTITNGEIQVVVHKVSGTQEVGVNYWDIVNNKQAGEGKVTVAADAYNVNSSQLTDIPEGYKLVRVGDFTINDGWIFVEVRPAGVKTVGVNYWDIDNNCQVKESSVVVDADAIHVNSSALTDIPAGYELVWTGDYRIYDGWIFVELRLKDSGMKTIGVNYWDIVNDKQAGEGSVIVDADATAVNTTTLTDVPAGYEVVWLGDVQINDGWIFVEVRPAEDSKTVGLNYWDIVNDKQVAEGSLTVDADATLVNTSTFTDIPKGYELVWTGDLPIVDGWVWVEVRPIEDKTVTVGLNRPRQRARNEGVETTT